MSNQDLPLSVFDPGFYDKMDAAWPGKDIEPIVNNYATVFINFHCECPAQDPLPDNRVGKPHSAKAVWLIKGGVKESFSAFDGGVDGNYQRAFLEVMNEVQFTRLAHKLDQGTTIEMLRAWKWVDTKAGQNPEHLKIFWEMMMDELKDWQAKEHVKEQAKKASSECKSS